MPLRDIEEYHRWVERESPSVAAQRVARHFLAEIGDAPRALRDLRRGAVVDDELRHADRVEGSIHGVDCLQSIQLDGRLSGEVRIDLDHLFVPRFGHQFTPVPGA